MSAWPPYRGRRGSDLRPGGRSVSPFVGGRVKRGWNGSPKTVGERVLSGRPTSHHTSELRGGRSQQPGSRPFERAGHVGSSFTQGRQPSPRVERRIVNRHETAAKRMRLDDSPSSSTVQHHAFDLPLKNIPTGQRRSPGGRSSQQSTRSSFDEPRRNARADRDFFSSRVVDNRETDKMEVHSRKYSRATHQSAGFAPRHGKERVRDLVDTSKQRMNYSASATSPLYRSSDNSEPFPFETDPVGDNLFNLGADVSAHGVLEKTIDDRADVDFAEQYPSYASNPSGNRATEKRRTTGLDLRVEVLGGRRYRGSQASVDSTGRSNVVQRPFITKSPSQLPPADNGGANRNFVRDPRERVQPLAMPPPGSLKRARPRSPEMPLMKCPEAVPAKELRPDRRTSATEKKYVVRRLENEEHRIRDIGLSRQDDPGAFVSLHKTSADIKELWHGFCVRELDANASMSNELFLDYMKVYYDELRVIYPNFARYYNQCKYNVTSRVMRPEQQSKKINEVSRSAAAMLLKKAKGVKPLNRHFAVSSQVRPVSNTNSHAIASQNLRRMTSSGDASDQMLKKTLPRDFHSAAPRYTGEGAPTHSKLSSTLQQRDNVSHWRSPSHVAVPRQVAQASVSGGRHVSERLSNRGSDVNRVERRSREHRSAGSSEKTAKPVGSDSWAEASVPLQRASLVAVADAAAATTPKPIKFDDPFKDFLHVTLTAMIVIGRLQRSQIDGRFTADDERSLKEERLKMETRMRSDMGHLLIRLARCIQQNSQDTAKRTLKISDRILNIVSNLDPVVIRTIACTPLL